MSGRKDGQVRCRYTLEFKLEAVYCAFSFFMLVTTLGQARVRILQPAFTPAKRYVMSRVRSIALGFLASLSAGYSVADTCWIETASIFNTLPGYTSPAVFLEPMGIEAAVEESGERWLKHDEGFRIQRLITAFVNPRMNEVWDRFPDFRGRPLQISSRYFCVSDKADLLSRRARLVTAAGRMTLMGDWTKALNASAIASPSSSNKTAGDATGAASGNLSKDEIAQANYERLKLERDKPGSIEARDAAARYQALLGKQKFTAEDVAMANYERLKTQRDNPGSKEAREAAARYNAMRGQQTKDRDGPTVSKDELAMANYERLRLAREKPGSAEAKVAESGYLALLKASQAQDKPARMRGPVLTRVGPDKPSAEAIAARKKADASGPSQPAAQSHSSQPGSSSPGSVPRTILCFKGTVPPPGYRCGTNKGSDAPGKGMSR